MLCLLAHTGGREWIESRGEVQRKYIFSWALGSKILILFFSVVLLCFMFCQLHVEENGKASGRNVRFFYARFKLIETKINYGSLVWPLRNSGQGCGFSWSQGWNRLSKTCQLFWQIVILENNWFSSECVSALAGTQTPFSCKGTSVHHSSHLLDLCTSFQKLIWFWVAFFLNSEGKKLQKNTLVIE